MMVLEDLSLYWKPRRQGKKSQQHINVLDCDNDLDICQEDADAFHAWVRIHYRTFEARNKCYKRFFLRNGFFLYKSFQRTVQILQQIIVKMTNLVALLCLAMNSQPLNAGLLSWQLDRASINWLIAVTNRCGYWINIYFHMNTYKLRRSSF